MTVGRKKVKVRTIPYTNHKITVKWDPILTKRETETAMFQMMKSSKKENLTNNERVDKFFGLIMYESVDRRDSPKVNKHHIAEYLHPDMKNADKVEILDWLMYKTFTHRYATTMVPLAHKMFLFHQLLQASALIFEQKPIKTWEPPAPFQEFKSYLDQLEERILADSLKPASSSTLY